MKKTKEVIEIIAINKKEMGLFCNPGYHIYYKPLKSFYSLGKQAREFEKKTGLETKAPQLTRLMALSKDCEKHFPNLPKKFNKPKEYKITIEEA